MKSEDSLFLKGNAKFLLLTVGIIMISNLAMSQYRLEIEITDFRNNKGALMLQLFDQNQTIVAQEKGVIQDKKCIVTFDGIKSGKYGIRFYHDENLSGQMETNLFGKPVEGYGFSNNARGKFGPPSFEKWLFELTSDKKITLKPVY
jgi:uncharacterized protein (DUF2141 family)